MATTPTETSPQPPAPAADAAPPEERRRGLSPRWVLAALVALSTAVLAVESRALAMPVVYVDELVYSLAAKQVAGGALPGFPDRGYGYGLVYPLLASLPYALLAHAQDAYAALKALNALVFSLAALPAYLLARRVAREPLALGVAALTLLLPAREYSSLVLTESAAFLAFLVAVLAIMRVVERPSVGRQLAAIALCGVAYETRRQLLVLAMALPLTLLVEAVTRSGLSRTTARDVLRRYAATWIVIAVAAVGIVAAAVARGGLGGALGPYSVLASGYSPGDVLRWIAYHVEAYGLTLGVIGLVALPFGLLTCLGRSAPAGRRAVGAATLVLVPLLLLQASVFSSSEYGLGRVHERYVVYAAPLALAMLAAWIDAGLPRARTALGVAVAAVVVALPLLLPATGLATFAVDAPFLNALGYGLDPTAGTVTAFRGVVLWASLLLVIWIFLLHRRHAALLLVVVGLAFLAVDVRTHRAFAADATRWEATATGGRAGLAADWVDRTIGSGAPVTMLYVAPPRSCPSRRAAVPQLVTAQWRTAFFNSGIVRLVTLDPGLDVAVPTTRARVRGGAVVAGGRPVTVRYVVADGRLPIAGQRLAADPATGLALWRVDGPLRVGGAAHAVVCGSR